MPVHVVSGRPGCYRWGNHGKVYCGSGAKAKAERQGRAIRASGYTGNRSILTLNRSTLTRTDPTKTTMLRRRFQAEMKRRFAKLKAALKDFLDTKDALGLKERKSFVVLAQPREFEFRSNPDKLDAFNDWLKRQIEADVFSVPAGTPTGAPWMAKHIESAFKRGQTNAYFSAKQGDLFEEDDVQQRALDRFLRESFNQPEATSKVRVLATRAFEDLKGVTSTMATRMNRILAQGMIDGTGVAELARAMAEQIGSLTESRALVIARTEVISAHAEGQLTAFEDLGVEDLGVLAEWSTAGDDAVCPQCEEMEGKTFTIDEARGLIPLHPNCRCTWIPAVPGMTRNVQTINAEEEDGHWVTIRGSPVFIKEGQTVKEAIKDRFGDEKEKVDTEPAEKSFKVMKMREKDSDLSPGERAIEEINGGETADVSTYGRYIGNSKVSSSLRSEFDTHFQVSDIRNDVIAMTDDLAKSEIKTDVVLFRGVNNDDFLRDLKPGDRFVDDAFLSTSPYEESDFILETHKYGGTVMKINAPAGSEGKYITRPGATFYGSEHEVLLQRSSVLELVGVEDKGKYNEYTFNLVGSKPESFDFYGKVGNMSKGDLGELVADYYQDRLELKKEDRDALTKEYQSKGFSNMNKTELLTFLKGTKWDPFNRFK